MEGSKAGAVVRAFVIHHCSPGLIPGPGVICRFVVGSRPGTDDFFLGSYQHSKFQFDLDKKNHFLVRSRGILTTRFPLLLLLLLLLLLIFNVTYRLLRLIAAEGPFSSSFFGFMQDLWVKKKLERSRRNGRPWHKLVDSVTAVLLSSVI